LLRESTVTVEVLRVSALFKSLRPPAIFDFFKAERAASFGLDEHLHGKRQAQCR
jgi:hypothetical protein